MSKKKKNLKEEQAPRPSRAASGQEDPTQRMIDQNDTMIQYLENMTNSLNAMVYYATKSRGGAADIEKSIGSSFVNEATMQAGKEQTYPSVDATDQRTDIPGADDRVADPRNLEESMFSVEELKNLIREQLFITRKKK
jgi:hypothetical protein